MVLMLLCSPDANLGEIVKKLLTSHTAWRIKLYDNLGTGRYIRKKTNVLNEDYENERIPIMQAAMTLKRSY